MCRPRTRRVSGILVPIAVLLGGCVAARAPAPAAGEQAAPAGMSRAAEPERTIAVIGQGEIEVRPDRVRISVGVDATAPSVAEAVSRSSTQMTAVIAAVERLGVSPRDVQTSSFSIRSERLQPERGRPASEGATVYHASNTVRILLHEIERAGAVLDAAVSAGANNVWGLSFERSDEAELSAQAREKAVRDARARAESLAQAGGVSLGAVISISEPGAEPQPRLGAAVERLAIAGAPPVEAGEIKLSAQVQVVFAIGK